MGSAEPRGPEVIQFEGVWSGIPELQERFGAVEIMQSFDSLERCQETDSIEPVRVFWTHDTDLIETHLFVSLPLVHADIPSRVYELCIDDDEGLARLYVIRRLGAFSWADLWDLVPHESDEQRWLAPEEKDISEAWHEVQRQTGAILPNREDMWNFQKLFADFNKKILNASVNG